MTSYTLPEFGLSEIYKLQKGLGSPCTMIQQSFLLACAATSGPVRTRASDISSCTCRGGQPQFGATADQAAVSFQGGPSRDAESVSLIGQPCVPR